MSTKAFRSAFPGFFTNNLADADSGIAAAVAAELGRQRVELELIASENIVSQAVIDAQGTILTNKYAEGYPGRRYYGGCQHAMWSKIWPLNGQNPCLGPVSPTCSQIQVLRPTRRCFWRCCSPGTLFWGLISGQAVI